MLSRGGEDLADPVELLERLSFRTSLLEAQAEAVDEGLLLVSPTGEIIAYNRRFAEQWGYDEALLATRSDEAALAEAVKRLVDADAFMDRVRYLYEHPDETSHDELRLQDGRVLERYSGPVRGPDGTRYGRLWAFRDVTAQLLIEQSLARRANEQAALYHFTASLHRARSLEEVYEAAIESILAGLGCDRASLLLFDAAGVMSFVASRSLSDGYRRAVQGHTPWRPDQPEAEPIPVPDIAESDLDPALKRTVLDEGIRAFAFVPLVAGERLIGKFMVYYDAPHVFTEQELRLALTIAHQIAFGIQRRRADEERARAEEALREADWRKDEFLATLAHELRNPLGPMRTALPLIESKLTEGQDVSRLLEILSRQTDRLSRLVDDLIDVSRITRGHIDLRREPSDLTPVVRRAVEATAEQAQSKGLTIVTELPGQPVSVLGDPVRLEQAVHNLLSNAIKYTAAGGRVAVRLSAGEVDAQIELTDTGVGIDPAFLPYVFDLFRQADRSLDRSEGGLGIGLTITRRLIELHDGRIEAHSDGPGLGSRFAVWLPLAPPGADAPAEPNTEKPLVAPLEPAARRRVLVVDDNRDQTEVMAELIERLGHDAAVAHDGAEALRVAAELRPEIVLLDIGLPGENGYEVAARIRRELSDTQLLLVAVTGYGQPSDRARSVRAGFDAHIVKPLGADLLERLLREGRLPTP